MVNGEVVKSDYIPKEKMSTLKVTGVCSVFQYSHNRNFLHS